MNITASLINVSKKHLLAIFFALFCGVLVLAPQVIFIANEGDHYKGYYMMKTEAEWFYLARMQEFYDEGRVGNPFLFEHKFYGPQFMQSGGEIILAAPGKLLGISIPTLNLIYKFVLPAITFLLLYALIFRLTKSAPWSIAGGLMYILNPTWLYINNVSHLLQGDVSFFADFLYSRPVHGTLDGIILFLYFNILLTLHTTRNVRWFVGLGALLALSFYTYFYSFTFFLALNFVVVLLWLCCGKKREAGYLTLATIGGILIGIPKLLAIYAAYHHPDYPLLAVLQPVEHGRTPVISKNGLMVSLFFVIYLFRTKALRMVGIIRDHSIFFLGLLITTFVVVNQQVLTGISLFSGHYHHSFNIPIFVIALTFLASAATAHFLHSEDTRSDVGVQGGNTRWNLGERFLRFHLVFPHLLRALPWLAAIIFIATGVFMQYAAYQNWAPQTSNEQRYMPALSWLRENTPKNSVVMANEALSDIIPVFTSNNDMWSRGAPLFLVPLDRARFTPENLLRSGDFLKDIKQYRVDYILWDQNIDPGWNIDRFHLPTLFSSEGLVIYELPK
ncbi:MAG: hypothetical protein A3D65_03265 [Candidatus Lloydbacteria bacterium RIFCSPHIGHO2_02_FULL_50_13]|uniref:Glycosyltransferase RgtA/B/C/D-like domain-containing protein n=1 Tax=Candidatus Lloydbacteria bacterium RIFCSPHIGHO2_02_FULL_50_13 TaxID=1798661 RepID=A0A1G2D772_9BACT|nr:MAG: hypothetical protein A3D65_03265 [Candidatus Lloydbacteria bacterium RIFCSPHIGHO2_02_FULL_50_13]